MRPRSHNTTTVERQDNRNHFGKVGSLAARAVLKYFLLEYCSTADDGSLMFSIRLKRSGKLFDLPYFNEPEPKNLYLNIS